MADIIAHIGYPKTGTTFLQHNVFPCLKNVTYIDHVRSKEMLYDIITKDPLDYDLASTRNRIQDCEESPAIPILLSQEQLCGSVFLNLGANRSQIATALKAVGVKKVMIGIRNQYDAIESLYKQYVHEGGVLSFNSFFSAENINQYNPVFNPGYFNYTPLISHYQSLFGEKNVLIVCNEDLRISETQEINRIVQFIGGETTYESSTKKSRDNSSLQSFSIQVLRHLNLLTFNRFRPRGILGNHFTSSKVRKVLHATLNKVFRRNEPLLNPTQKEQVNRWYQQSNNELSALIDTDLKAKGYP